MRGAQRTRAADVGLAGEQAGAGGGGGVLETAGRFGSVDDHGVVLMLDDGYSDD